MKHARVYSTNRHRAQGSSRQHGLSLIEVMVSLVIGLVAVGAVFANYINSSSGTRQAASLAQVTQDASLALGILRNHIAIAGYSSLTGATANGLTRSLTGPVIFGCDEGFDSGTESNVDLDTVTCAAASTNKDKPDSVAVRYETDSVTTPTVQNTDAVTGAKTDVPTDCVGVGLPVNANNKYVADNRFFIDPGNGTTEPPSLSCQGNGGNSLTSRGNKQRLVDNVTDMQIVYGMGTTDASGKAGNTIVRYVHASDMPAATRADNWNNVIAVRICVVVRSTDNVLSERTPYVNCTGNVVTPSATTDRYIYRAFTSTVVLNNRVDSN